MPVHIDEIESVVQAEPAPAATTAAPAEPDWQTRARLQAALQQLLMDERRTQAHGNQD